MIKRKIMSLILLLSVTFTLCPSFAVFADGFNEEYIMEIEFLKNLKLIDDDYDATLVITKGEISVMLLDMLYPETDFSSHLGEPAFNDVTNEHKYYSYIKACRDLGIVNGDLNGNFNPDRQISLIDALTMVINSLGYSYHAEQFGGYPTGYYEIARQTGVLKNVGLSLFDIINGGDAARIIYNSLFANPVKMVSLGTDGVKLEVDSTKTILSDRFSIYEYDATVIDNGIVSIEGNSIDDREKAVIRLTRDGSLVTAYISDTNVSSYLGHRVKAYIKNNTREGRYEFVYVAPHKNSEIVTLNAKNIINVTASYVEYDLDENTSDTDKVNLSSEKPVLIYNGVKIIDKTLSELLPSDGYVEFSDNTGDGKYDVILIYSFNYFAGMYNVPARNIVVDSVITEEDNEGISCLFNPIKSIELNSDEYIYDFIINGEFKSLKDIEKGMVVSVAECPEKIDGKTYYMLAVSEKSLEDNLDSVGQDGKLFVSSGTQYELSTSITSVKASFLNTLKIGKEIELFLDITGKVAYAKTEDGAAKDYAYIVKAVKKSDSDEYILIKFFSKDGKMNEMVLSDKAAIDGIRLTGKTADEKLSLINDRPSVSSIVTGAETTGRPAIIKVSDNKIVSIDTDTPNPNLSTGNISETYVQQSVIQYYEDDANSFDTLKAGFRSPRIATLRGANKSVGGKFFVTSETTILHVPEIDTWGLKNLSAYKPYGHNVGYANYSFTSPEMIKLYEMDREDINYSVLSLANIYTAFSLDLQGYDIDPDTGVAGLLVIRGRKDTYRSGSISHTNPISIFLETTEAYNETLEKKITKVHYYEQGEKKSATIDLDSCFYPYKYLLEGCTADATPHNIAVKALEKGEPIRIVLSSKGDIVHIERVLNLDEIANAGGFFNYSKVSSVPYSKTAAIDTITGFPYDMPKIDDDNYITPESSYALSMCYANMINGSVIQLSCTKNNGDLFSAIDLTNSTSYSNLYYGIGNINITVLDISSSGEIKVDKGTVNDIITLKDANGDTQKASVLLTKITGNEITEIIVINGSSNI